MNLIADPTSTETQGRCDSLRVVYAGTPEFAVPALLKILEAGHQVVGVYTQPDRPAGRGRQLKPSPVKACALEHQLQVLQPRNFKASSTVDELRSLQPDVMVVAAYGLLLPLDVLEIPPLGCLNIHASLLPKWRGAAPLQRAILAGDSTTGVTIMHMDEGLDTGAMLETATIAITPDMTCARLHDALAEMGAETLVKLLPPWCRGEIKALAQPVSDEVSYASKLSKSEAQLDWQQSAQQCHRKIMAFNPWPVAETLYDGQRLRIWQSSVLPASMPSPDESVLAGDVVRADGDELWVQTGDGIVVLESVQMPGKKAMPVAEFLKSRDLTSVRFGVQLDESLVKGNKD